MRLDMHTRRAIIKAHYRTYQKAAKKQRGEILDSLVATTGLNRDYLAHVLSRYGKKTYTLLNGEKLALVAQMPSAGRRKAHPGGRPKLYTKAFTALLVSLWEHFGHRCGKLLCPMLRSMLRFILADGNWNISEEHQALLLRVSPATIDRLLRPVKKKLWPKGRSLTKPGPLLKHQIPVRVYFRWDERKPGFFELDTVSHCGVSTCGEFCLTLTLTDVYSGWTEERALLNNAHRWVKQSIAEVCAELPFPMRGIDSDNGGEFINHQLLSWCREHQVEFTRSRPYRKNDNCFVEQKNGDIVRKAVGCHRYDTQQEFEALAEVYRLMCPLLNYWYPTIKTTDKIKLENGKTRKIREKAPRTPYQRLLESGDIREEQKNNLRRTAASQNPVQMQRLLNEAVERLLQINRQKGKSF
jgi:hypothetical protein